MIVTEVVKKKPEAEIPKEIMENIILEQKKDTTKLRTSNIGMATVFLTNFIRCRTSFRMYSDCP